MLLSILMVLFFPWRQGVAVIRGQAPTWCSSQDGQQLHQEQAGQGLHGSSTTRKAPAPQPAVLASQYCPGEALSSLPSWRSKIISRN